MSFIAIRTRPVALDACQWHQPGDLPDIVVSSGVTGMSTWGVHSASHGFQKINPGDWVVFEGGRHSPRVYGNANFHANFEIVEP